MARKSRKNLEAAQTHPAIKPAFNVGAYIRLSVVDRKQKGDSINGQSGGIMVSLKNMVNETYAIEVGRKIRATHQMNIRDGRYVGNLPPYGCLKSRDDCHKLVPDEYAAPIVRHIYGMAADGQSVKATMRWLTENEVLTPSRYFHSIGLLVEKKISPHTHWSYRAVDTLLSSRMYCGDMVQGKSKTVNHVTKNCQNQNG